MRRESHVRICEGLRVRFPGATRLYEFIRSNELMTEELSPQKKSPLRSSTSSKGILCKNREGSPS